MKMLHFSKKHCDKFVLWKNIPRWWLFCGSLPLNTLVYLQDKGPEPGATGSTVGQEGHRVNLPIIRSGWIVLRKSRAQGQVGPARVLPWLAPCLLVLSLPFWYRWSSRTPSVSRVFSAFLHVCVERRLFVPWTSFHFYFCSLQKYCKIWVYGAGPVV